MENKIIYNVTTIIDHSCHNEWLEWMKSTHIPDILSTGFFTDCNMMRILEDHNPDGVSYAIQYKANSYGDYAQYQEEHAARLQNEVKKKFEGKYASFRTLMKVV
jgi:hypothetical protein